MGKRLMTLDEFLGMSPRAQGYLAYTQGNSPGSELRKFLDYSPYPPGTPQAIQFAGGMNQAIQQEAERDKNS